MNLHGYTEEANVGYQESRPRPGIMGQMKHIIVKGFSGARASWHLEAKK